MFRMVVIGKLKYILANFLLMPIYSVVSQPTFTEVSELSGIIHHNVSPDYMGGGVAFFDYNNDGFEDIYLTGGARDDKLFHNNGDGTFTDVSESSGINKVVPAKSTGVVTGDINNDGYREIFVAIQGNKPNYLYMNNTDGTFTEISSSAGIKGNNWSMGATFGDFNLDGFLDLYVINYIKNNGLIYDKNNTVIGFAHECYENELYINNGNNTFTDISVESGTNDDGCALAVAFTDFDNDDIPDLYIANDFGAWLTPNKAFRNTSSSDFSDLSEQTGLDAAIYGMGIAIGDYDHDGYFDYFISNLGKNVLLQSNGDGSYANVADVAQVGNEYVDGLFATSWGTAFLDYDLDGWEDIAVANGYIPSAKFIETQKDDPNKLYRNNGQGVFEDVSEGSGIDDTKIGRGLATGDYDNDGDPDLLISYVNIVSATNINASLYRNDIINNNNWIKVKLEGTISNRDAFGAKVMIHAGDDRWMREIDGGSSHASQSSSIALVGIAGYEKLDSIVVRWPGGASQKIENIQVNQTIYIKEREEGYEVLGCMDESSLTYNKNATKSTACRYDNILGIDDLKTKGIKVFPNPVFSILKLYIPDNFKGRNLKFRLMDISGGIQMEDFIEAAEIPIDRNRIRKGLYLYQITDGTQVLKRGRLALD